MREDKGSWGDEAEEETRDILSVKRTWPLVAGFEDGGWGP